MQNPLFKKPETPDLSQPAAQELFVQQTQSAQELLQKELDVNRAEQTLLIQKITLEKQMLNDLPSTDPQYALLLTQIKMDQIEKDELKIRELSITKLLSEII